MKRHLYKILNLQIVQHTALWGVVYWVLINLFTNTDFEKVDYIYTLLFVFTLQCGVYVHRMLIFKYLKSQRFYIFIILTGICIFLFANFNNLFFNYLVDYILPEYYFISYYNIIDLSKFFVVVIVLTTMLKMSKDWLKQEDIKTRLIILEKEKAEVELKALMAQVNPHFLFNSLNVLYSLAIKNSAASPDAILKLSDVLRYVIYDSNKEKVKLSDEQALINNYLGLQAYRTNEDAQVSFTTDIQDDVEIAPLLFLPLIENSFKHGVKGDVGSTYVAIHLVSRENEVCFTIRNNVGESSSIEKTEGIGLENIRQRLDLIYPDNYSFIISEDNNEFKVTLKVKIR